MQDARDTQLDYVHRSCMWAGNDEAGDLEQPRTFGADDLPPREPMSPAERVLLAFIYVLSAAGVCSLLSLLPWGRIAAALGVA